MARTTLVMVALLALACGDDSPAESTPDGGEPQGEPCLQRGQTETGCTCEEPGSLGVRSCTAELVWTPCSCPPVDAEGRCRPGRPVVCQPCPGEQDVRRGVCGESGEARCPSCDEGDE